LRKAKKGESQKEGQQQDRIHRSFLAVHRLGYPSTRFASGISRQLKSFPP